MIIPKGIGMYAMETRNLLEGRKGKQSQDNNSKSYSLPEDNESLSDISLNASIVLQTIEILADQLESILKNVELGWKQSLNRFIDKLKQNPSEFNFIEYREYLTAIDQYRGNQCTTTEQLSTAEKLQRLFLSFGFCVAGEDLLNCAREKAKELEPGSVVDAAGIVREFQSEFTPKNFDPEVLFEKIEILWRVKKALMKAPDEENQTRLGILAERSGSKSCWWFFLGLVFLEAGSALFLATQGVAILYLTGFAEWSITGKPATLTMGMLTSETGLGMLWWQQKRYPTAFCCFWHRMKEIRAEDEQVEKIERAKKTQ